MQNRRHGDRRHRLISVLTFTAGFYCALFVWPTPWRYDHIGKNPVRTNRVTGDVEILTLQGWEPALPPFGVRRPNPQRQFRGVALPHGAAVVRSGLSLSGSARSGSARSGSALSE
jgi:hypothetical protein